MITAITSNVPGNGAKFVATNLAVASNVLNKEKKVLLIDFDLNNPTLGRLFYEGNKKDSFNIIIDELLKKGTTSVECLKEAIYSTEKGFDILIGRNVDEIDYYNDIPLEGYENLFNMLDNIYDYIFVVINKEPDNIVTVATLANVNNVVIVGRNNYSNLIAINRTMKIIRTYTNNAMIYYLTNMFEDNKNSLSKTKELKNVKILGNIKYGYSAVDNRNLKNNLYSKLNSNNRTFINAVKTIRGEKK